MVIPKSKNVVMKEDFRDYLNFATIHGKYLYFFRTEEGLRGECNVFKRMQYDLILRSNEIFYLLFVNFLLVNVFHSNVYVCTTVATRLLGTSVRDVHLRLIL